VYSGLVNSVLKISKIHFKNLNFREIPFFILFLPNLSLKQVKFSFLLRNRQYKVVVARSYLRVPIPLKSNMAAKAGKPCPGSMLFEININFLA